MSDMVERVARAICEAYGHEWRTGTYPAMTGPNFEMEDHDADRLNNGWRHIARAAIEAMREMNEPALEKAVSAHLDWRPTKDTPRTPCQDFGMQQREILTYQTKAALGAYFDAALSQDTHSPSPLNPPADEEGAAANSGEAQS